MTGGPESVGRGLASACEIAIRLGSFDVYVLREPRIINFHAEAAFGALVDPTMSGTALPGLFAEPSRQLFLRRGQRIAAWADAGKSEFVDAVCSLFLCGRACEIDAGYLRRKAAEDAEEK